MPAIDAVAATQTIDNILRRYRAATSSQVPAGLLPANIKAGKLYEAWVLSVVLGKLVAEEGYRAVLRGSTKPTLHLGHGPINRQYPYFEMLRRNRPALEVWTDIEFLTLSYAQQTVRRSPQPGDFHELDIVVVATGTRGRPRHDEIQLGVECKATHYGKHLLREILGVRRELSFYQNPRTTAFVNWPRADVPANPPSCLMVFCTDTAVLTFADPGDVFGVDFVHEAAP
ncbi:MAG: hypothetical protein R3C39_13495 [Dehalococcoidia bacterium]